jgi:hypothetical protein
MDEQDATYAAVEHLGDIIPSLIVLSDEDAERAASTDIVWRTIAKASSRPFSIGIVLVDLVVHVALLLTVRYIVFWVPEPTPFDGNVPKFDIE